ncbi:MAG: CpaF family protein [Candidatus Omnitrophica bacterium]|nr:CpaF family protein [Candidatus Omnitrophota bacterium]
MIKKFKDRIRNRLVSEYVNLFSKEEVDTRELERIINYVLDELINREHAVLSPEDRKKIMTELVDEFTGHGPIESLLQDSHVTEIMINGPKKIYVEKDGKTELSNVIFDSEHQLMYLIHKILAPTRRHVDESFPYTDVSLKDGSRVNIILPPLALDGPVVTIRKFLREIKQMDDLVKMGTLDQRMSDFLLAALKARLNILFSGATGAGKTTSLNVLSYYIPNNERIITIEDTAELRLTQEHLVRLETRQANIEGRGEVTIKDLFKNSLRMRPDRIILGEIRSDEAMDMLQAMCSGHSGSLAVIHADSPQDVIYRMETLILSSGIPMTLDAIHRQIAAAVNLIVQQEQLSDGSRKITQIAQVNGLKNNQANVEDIFRYEIEGLDPVKGNVIGKFCATGIVPVAYHKFRKLGINLPEEIFKEN